MKKNKNYGILEKYIIASKKYNIINKNKFRVDLFLDFNFLNIYIRNLKTNKFFKLQIVCNFIPDLEINEIIKCYIELESKCFRKQG